MPDNLHPTATDPRADPSPTADHATATGPEKPTAAPVASDVPAPPAAGPPAIPGYELLDEVGRGGMGVVWRARDLALDRDVAVKLLADRYAPDSPAARRFLDEARITGQLQHPGVPAVHQVGTLPDGRPFLAMKLIKGRTLDELLGERADPSADRGRLVAAFEQVCQAVGYAHAHRVVHRDLKPANVMVGAFGEVQVMDWGLAKPIGDGPTAEPRPDADTRGTEIRSLRDGGDLTQAGSLLGTPAFMPPEQAIGAVAEIDERSDVFGLGAILCVILTGRPPYVGSDSESTRQLAARARLEDAATRLDGCGAEPELVALAKRCLAAEKADRPADAGEVASAVAALRADAERRLRQAELDRARAEVKSAEERKRRRVQYALALSVVGLLAGAGVAAWWVDSLRSQRRADQQADELRRVAADQQRVADLKARQLVTERDVGAALNEARVLREQGWKLADDTDRWALTLTTARSSLRRAEGLLAAGEPTDELRGKVAAASAELANDDRDRTLLVELDRTTDVNEIRLLIPVSFTGVTARQFASAFRAHGIDLLTVQTEEAVAWLKGHRFRGRLVTAIRYWQQSFPGWDVNSVADTSFLEASPAVAGNLPVVALGQDPGRPLEKLLRKTGPHARLGEILKGVTDDPFAREWWDAVERKDLAKLKTLVQGPEVRRLSSRELSSLADGLNPLPGKADVLTPFLDIAHERFPGEFWVHFRLAFHAQIVGTATEEEKQKQSEKTRRHLTAALAIRPRSAIARAALAMESLERRKDDPAGLRMLHSASEADPTSPWPHLFIGILALERKDWPEAFRAMKESVRADPDVGFFMTSSMAIMMLAGATDEQNGPPQADIVRLMNELIAAQPKHPGGYDLLAKFYSQRGDDRSALAQYRKAQGFSSPDYPGRFVIEASLKELEAKARWEEKLPAFLRGEVKPANSTEVAELAGYCATFEQRFALATRIVAEGMKADPTLLDNWWGVAQFAGWAVQAAAGHGADAADHTDAERAEFRRLALKWMRDLTAREKEIGGSMGLYFSTIRNFAPVRDPKELATLPPDDRAEWGKLWAEVTAAIEKQRPKKYEVAPPPRPAK